MTLFHSGEKDAPEFSQVAYAISYYPWKKLTYGEKKLICWKRSLVWSKQHLLSKLNEELTEIYLPGEGVFTLHWEFNNIPTQTQWDRYEDWTKFLLSFRISPAIRNGGRIAVLNLYTGE